MCGRETYNMLRYIRNKEKEWNDILVCKPGYGNLIKNQTAEVTLSVNAFRICVI